MTDPAPFPDFSVPVSPGMAVTPPMIPPPPGAPFTPPPPPSAALDIARKDAAAWKAFGYSLGASAVGGLAWFAVVAGTNRLWFYLAFGIGMLSARAAAKGAGRAGRDIGIAAGAATAIAMVVSLYFIFRALAVRALTDARIPLWIGFSRATDLMRIGLKLDPMVGLAALGSAIVAGFVSAKQR